MKFKGLVGMDELINGSEYNSVIQLNNPKWKNDDEALTTVVNEQTTKLSGREFE